MSEIINHITAFQPVYRVLNREENLDFYREVLGFKVLVEEGAMVWLGGHEAKKIGFN
ncbi:CppA N-terminal domain-containing protein [Lactococcus lactis]|nr:CppA N-terminal domain-containing protein [Lactococcus lactis]